jgi:uncharacterized protein
MRLHDSFEWDEDKAEKNLKKHRVSFDDAASVLADEEGDFYHVEEFDWKHSNGEDRHITTGSHPEDRRIVFRISWTNRFRGNERITRIISARPVTPSERRKYAKEISSR